MNKNFKKTYHFPWLDALRFLAAFLVLLSHSRNDFFLPFNKLPLSEQNILSSLFYFIGRLGHEAVIVFFVISGFLVGGIGLERIINRTFNLKLYVIDRSVRIYIPLLAAIILYYIICILLNINFNWIAAIGNFFNLQGILVDSLVSPFWSLSYEVWFYIILASIALIFTKKNIYGYLLFCICCIIFISLEARYLFMWFLGAFAYLCKPTKKKNLILIVALLGIISMVVLSQLSSESHIFKFRILLSKDLIEFFLSIFICLFIQQIILDKSIEKNTYLRIIEKNFSYLSSFSYTLYLSHRIIFLILFCFWDQGKATFTFLNIISYSIFILLTMLSCWCVYYISEKYTSNIKSCIKNYIQ